MEGLISGGKFELQNQLSLLIVRRQIKEFSVSVLFWLYCTLYSRAISKNKPPWGLPIFRGAIILMKGCCVTSLGVLNMDGLILEFYCSMVVKPHF